MREIVNVHDILHNVTSDSDDIWDGDQDFSFDLTENDNESVYANHSSKMPISYCLATTSSYDGVISRDHLQNIILEDRDSLTKTCGFVRRNIKDHEISLAMVQISSSNSSNSNSSFSAISNPGNRDLKSRGKIAYLNEEFPVDPECSIFKVCTEKSVTSAGLRADASTKEDRFLLGTTGPYPNDAATTCAPMAGESRISECPFEFESSSDMVSWRKIASSPDVNSTEKPIPWAPLREHNEEIPAVNWIPREIVGDSNLSPSVPLGSNNNTLPVWSDSIVDCKQKNVHAFPPCQPAHRPLRLLQLFSGRKRKGRKGSKRMEHPETERTVKGSTRESSTSSEDCDDYEDNSSTRDDDIDGGLPGWYRSTDMVVSSMNKNKEAIKLSDWTILVVTNRQGADDDEKVEPYHIHKSMMSCGRRRSEYFVREFEDYARKQPNGAFSIVRLENSVLANMFPYMLDFIYSSHAANVCSWEHLDRSSLLALRALGERFGVAELEQATGPCDV